MQHHLFTALGMLNPDPATIVVADSGYADEDRTLIGLSSNLRFFGGNQYALLDAWQSHPDWMRGLTAYLIEVCRQPAHQEDAIYGLRHEADLLRERYRRSASLAERGALCRDIGPQQGWPYTDLVHAYQEQEQWAQVLSWADDGLARLAPHSRYRPLLEEARGTALLHLDRPAEALATLQSLFLYRHDASVYLTLRAAAQATGTWAQVYTEVTGAGEQQVLAERSHHTSSSLLLAALLGYAYLLEGQIERAVAWAMRPEIPAGWSDNDLQGTVAGGLLRMGLTAARAQPDAILREAVDAAPALIRQHGDGLDAAALTLTPDLLFDSAVRVYDRLLDRAVDGRKRESYAVAGSYAQIIRAIRQTQGRPGDFDIYYQHLFETYARLPACKDELRRAIEGRGYTQKRKR